MPSKEELRDSINIGTALALDLTGRCEGCGGYLRSDETLHWLMVQLKSELRRRGYVARPIDRDLFDELAVA